MKFNSKEELDQWARENIKNPRVLEAVLKPTFIRPQVTEPQERSTRHADELLADFV